MPTHPRIQSIARAIALEFQDESSEFVEMSIDHRDFLRVTIELPTPESEFDVRLVFDGATWQMREKLVAALSGLGIRAENWDEDEGPGVAGGEW